MRETYIANIKPTKLRRKFPDIPITKKPRNKLVWQPWLIKRKG